MMDRMWQCFGDRLLTRAELRVPPARFLPPPIWPASSSCALNFIHPHLLIRMPRLVCLTCRPRSFTRHSKPLRPQANWRNRQAHRFPLLALGQTFGRGGRLDEWPSRGPRGARRLSAQYVQSVTPPDVQFPFALSVRSQAPMETVHAHPALTRALSRPRHSCLCPFFYFRPSALPPVARPQASGAAGRVRGGGNAPPCCAQRRQGLDQFSQASPATLARWDPFQLFGVDGCSRPRDAPVFLLCKGYISARRPLPPSVPSELFSPHSVCLLSFSSSL